MLYFYFFKQKTAYDMRISDWSSDVCSSDLKTNFVPDKVTLTEGDKVVWLNHDNSEHRITVGSDSRSGYQLLNSLVLQNRTIEHQFQLSGTYYSVLDDPGSRGTVTILDKAIGRASSRARVCKYV